MPLPLAGPAPLRRSAVVIVRRAAVVLAAAVLLAGCATGTPDELVPAAESGSLEQGPAAVPERGPYRHTGRAQFRWSIGPVTAARLGSSHRAGCPVPVSDLRLLQLTHLGFDGRPHLGELVVHRASATDVVEVFRALYRAHFPIERMVTVDAYGGSDERSMEANNTSGYNCRLTTGGSRFSEHAYGTAIDVNPVQNPYVNGTTVLPEAGRAYLDRADVRPGMVLSGDVVVRAFAAAGWKWGGDYRSLKDYQHFSASGS